MATAYSQRRWRGGTLRFEVLDKDGEALIEFEARPSPDRAVALRGRFDLTGAAEIRITVPDDEEETLTS